jgi:hypothetical protein
MVKKEAGETLSRPWVNSIRAYAALSSVQI